MLLCLAPFFSRMSRFAPIPAPAALQDQAGMRRRPAAASSSSPYSGLAPFFSRMSRFAPIPAPAALQDQAGMRRRPAAASSSSPYSGLSNELGLPKRPRRRHARRHSSYSCIHRRCPLDLSGARRLLVPGATSLLVARLPLSTVADSGPSTRLTLSATALKVGLFAQLSVRREAGNNA
ncbi:hypothetical protein U9M48_020161 [Paspalum notatum var. saurae]|uniref:Uncharacterized protein n=1 Tax=Paspalum notatum var. saurae TaxID=547442 RepID=A0AAQ3WSA0_PASNO